MKELSCLTSILGFEKSNFGYSPNKITAKFLKLMHEYADEKSVPKEVWVKEKDDEGGVRYRIYSKAVLKKIFTPEHIRISIGESPLGEHASRESLIFVPHGNAIDIYDMNAISVWKGGKGFCLTYCIREAASVVRCERILNKFTVRSDELELMIKSALLAVNEEEYIPSSNTLSEEWEKLKNESFSEDFRILEDITTAEIIYSQLGSYWSEECSDIDRATYLSNAVQNKYLARVVRLSVSEVLPASERLSDSGKQILGLYYLLMKKEQNNTYKVFAEMEERVLNHLGVVVSSGRTKLLWVRDVTPERFHEMSKVPIWKVRCDWD